MGRPFPIDQLYRWLARLAGRMTKNSPHTNRAEISPVYSAAW